MLILTIWPLFALICLGYLLAQKGFPDPGFWPAAERLNYVVLFPALLVVSLARAPLDDPALLRLGGAVVAALCLAALVLFAARALHPVPAARFGPVVQGVIRFNTYIGLAVTLSLGGPGALSRAAVLLAVAVPLVNLLSILALTETRGPGLARRLGAAILRNPLILACIAGMALAGSGIGLPWGTEAFAEMLARASLPLGLLCVGAALRPEALRRDAALLAGVSVLRLLAMPVLGFAMARVFGLGGTEALVLVIFAAIPTAPTAYVLTRSLGGDGTLMAGLITAQTLAAAATIPLVLWLLGLA